MLNHIGNVKNIPAFLEDVKDRNNHEMLWGFGHRVYKNYDPRAKIIQKACLHDVLAELGIKGDPLLDLAMEAGENRAERQVLSSIASCIRTWIFIPASS